MCLYSLLDGLEHGTSLCPATKKIYKLSDQERPAELAAKRVKIKGRLDKATQTIYVSSIERCSSPSSKEYRPLSAKLEPASLIKDGMDTV